MTDVQRVSPGPSAVALAALSTDDLKRRLAEAITVTARGLYETALIYDELRQRGEPVEEMRIALAPYLPRIARGEMSAEAVVALAGYRTALDRIALMPIHLQKEAVAREYPVVTAISGAGPVIVTRRIAEMSAREVTALISDDGRIRSPDAQVEVAKTPRPHASTGARRLPRGRQPKISVSGDYVVIGRQAVRADYLTEQLVALGLISMNAAK